MSDTELSKCSPGFESEYKKLSADAIAFHDTVKEENAAKEAIKTKVDSLAGKYKGHPNELLVILIVEVLGSKTSNAHQLQLKEQAGALNIQKDLTNLSSDIQNIPSGKGPKTMPGGATTPKGQGIKWVAADTDEMQNALGTSPSSQFSGKSWAGYIRTALGAEPCNMMTSNFQNIRNDIYWTGDPEAKNYNPKPYGLKKGQNGQNPPSASNPGSYTSYHFDPDAGKTSPYITSYSEMRSDLSVQGNPKGAQDANKTLLDSFSQNVSATQSMGQASNAEIGLITSAIKENTSFVSSVSQDILTGNRSAIRNQLAQ